MTKPICKHCKQEMIYCGFERRLIMRGKDKGKYIVTDFFKCKSCDYTKKVKDD